MYEDIIEEIIKRLCLNYNKCFNKIIEIDNLLIIENSNYTGSSIYEGRELLDIEEKLQDYSQYLDIEISLEKVVLKLK